MGVDMPAGSYGVWIVKAADDTAAAADSKNGKPSRMESWAVPLSYEKTVAAMRSVLSPDSGDFDGIPWLKETIEDKPDSHYVDWWWGTDDQPLILVRIQQDTGVNEAEDSLTSVDFERRD
jgi:hypothetical protein